MEPVPNRANSYRGTANPQYIQAMRELRRSSAASPHETPKQKGSRQSKKQKAIKDDQDG